MPDGKPARNVGREIALSLAAAALFGFGLWLYLVRTTAMPQGPVLVGDGDRADAARLPDDLEVARAIAAAYVEHVRAGRFDGALALMAAPYRDRHDAADLRAAWPSSPLLTGMRAVRLTATRSEAARLPDGRLVAPATFTARGTLVTGVGALDASFTFLRARGEAHILTVVVGGAPIVSGMGER